MFYFISYLYGFDTVVQNIVASPVYYFYFIYLQLFFWKTVS